MKKSFLFFAMLAVFVTCGEYAIVRPASNCLFLSTFSAKTYPIIWLFSIPLNLAVIWLYNRFLPKLRPVFMFCLFASISIAINLFAFFFYKQFPYCIFFQYAWKDVAILLMLKQVWSLIHSTKTDQPRKSGVYGIIYAVGTSGAILGSCIPAFFATIIGSQNILLLTAPLYCILVFAYAMSFKYSNTQAISLQEEFKTKDGFALLQGSRSLVIVLCLVIFMQVSVGLMEYQFNGHLENQIQTHDLRTAYYGKVLGWTNILSLSFQLVGSLFLVSMLGLRGGHLFIPTLLLCIVFLAVFFPTFTMISVAFALIKAIDFSLFGVLREMLYSPLKLEEKFRAKAIIDVFAYRTAKALISLALISLQFVVGASLIPVLPWASLIILCGWIAFISLYWKQTPALSDNSARG